MGRRIIEVVIIFFDILAVVALFTIEAKETLFQDGVVSIPEGRGEADELVAIAEAGDAIFSPAVGFGARLVVRQVIPGRAVGTVVLAHRSPLPLAHIRPPTFPVNNALAVLL